MHHKLAYAALAALCFTTGAMAESSVSNLIVTLAAHPRVHAGACPAEITFTGDIAVQGNFQPGSPVEMGYTFLRSDNATGPISYFTLTAPDTRTVSTTWTLGGPGLPSYNGWVQLKAWPTRHAGGFGYSFSPRAAFRVSCGPEGGATAPRLEIGATLQAVPPTYNGHCPAVITFNGQINVAGAVPAPVEIGYTFLRSDNATGPVKYLNVSHPGAYPVQETWTLGGMQLPSYSGWQQLKVWPTHHEGGIGEVFSPRADFLMHCR